MTGSDKPPQKENQGVLAQWKETVGFIASISAIFAVVEIFLPTNLVLPIGVLVIGLIVTGILVQRGKWSLKTAFITWGVVIVALGFIYCLIAISRPAIIVGSVVDCNKHPMAKLKLVLRDSSGVPHEMETDDKGGFEIPNVPEGEFTIEVGGQFLIIQSVPSGWKRIFEPVVNVGNLSCTLGTPTPTPTDTSLPSPSPTATPSSTPTSTSTPVPPADTPTPMPPTDTPVPPTDTPVPPTATPKPTLPAPIPTPNPTPPTCVPLERLTGEIAFPVYQGEQKDIYIAELGGVKPMLKRLTPNASEPVLSPDGSQIAFRSWNASTRGLMVMNIDGTKLQRVSLSLEDTHPYWALEESLVFHSTKEGHTPRLYTAGTWEGANGENNVEDVRPGLDPAYGQYPAWVPDGRIIYKYFEQSGNFRGLYVMNSDGSNPTPITDHPGDTMPSVSPRGDRVAFMSDRTSKWEVYIVNMNGNGLKQLTDSGGYNSGLPTWSPDGRYIAFVSDRGNQWAIWVMKSDGSCERKLFDLNGTLNWGERISWAP